MKKTLRSLCIMSILFICTSVNGQSLVIDLNQIVNEWTLHSPQAKSLSLSYANELLQYDNYRKSFLPSFSLNLNPISFNRSLKTIQHPDDGSYSYIEDYLNNSSVGLTINQKIGLTGGEITVGTYLNALNEFSDKRNSFSTTPFSISYTQELFGGNHNYKKEKQIQSVKQYHSVKQYCSELAAMQTQGVNLFMDAFLSWLNKDLSAGNILITDTLLTASKRLLDSGRLAEYDYKQMELQHLTNQYNQESSLKSYSKAIRELFVFLGKDVPVIEEIEISPPVINIPGYMDYLEIVWYAERNNPFRLGQEIKKQEAEQQLYKVKLSNRINASINVSYGLNQYAENFIDAYRKPNSRQAVSLSLKIPLFQWGIGKNNIRIAENNYENTLITLKDSETQFVNELQDMANDYNYAINLCRISREAFLLSQQQYRQLSQKFSWGKVSVYELGNAQQEQFTAMQKYYSSIKTVWENYYVIRQITLFDPAENKELTEIFTSEELIEKIMER